MSEKHRELRDTPLPPPSVTLAVPAGEYASGTDALLAALRAHAPEAVARIEEEATKELREKTMKLVDASADVLDTTEAALDQPRMPPKTAEHIGRLVALWPHVKVTERPGAFLNNKEAALEAVEEFKMRVGELVKSHPWVAFRTPSATSVEVDNAIERERDE